MKAIALATLSPLLARSGTGFRAFQLVRRTGESDGSRSVAMIEATVTLDRHDADLLPWELIVQWRLTAHLERTRNEEELGVKEIVPQVTYEALKTFFSSEHRDVLAEALAAARAIVDEGWRARALAAVALAGSSDSSAPALLAEALAAARAIEEEWWRAEALAAVAHGLIRLATASGAAGDLAGMAAALALAHGQMGRWFRPNSRVGKVKRGRPPGDVERPWEQMLDDVSPAFFVVGHGSDRRTEHRESFDDRGRRRTYARRFLRVAALFEEPVTLAPIDAWLALIEHEDPSLFHQVESLLGEVIPDECRFTPDKDEQGDFVFLMRGTPVSFGTLSDGYRAFIGWFADLLYHLVQTSDGTPLRDRSGIVLVDEIDLHLHPSWQRTVVPRLAAALPRLQFILTTHSPIVTGRLHAENIFVMEADESGASTVRQFSEEVHGLSAEQVLLSSYFGLDTTRAESAERELATIASQAEPGDYDAAIRYLRALRQGIESNGGSGG